MLDRSLARSILGGAAVVVLSGTAAFFGAGLAQREPAPIAARPAAGGVDAATLDAIDRRLAYIERRLDALETHAAASQDPESAPVRPAPVPATLPPKPGTPATTEPAPVPDDPVKREQAVRHEMIRSEVLLRMKLFADASNEGPANRLAQAVSDSTQFIIMFGLRGDDVLERVRKIYQEEWETGARDIGPLVHDGLGKADVATVRDRLHGIWSASDARLRQFFDDEKWKQYETKSAALRKPVDEVLDEFEKDRLNTK